MRCDGGVTTHSVLSAKILIISLLLPSLYFRARRNDFLMLFEEPACKFLPNNIFITCSSKWTSGLALVDVVDDGALGDDGGVVLGV